MQPISIKIGNNIFPDKAPKRPNIIAIATTSDLYIGKKGKYFQLILNLLKVRLWSVRNSQIYTCRKEVGKTLITTPNKDDVDTLAIARKADDIIRVVRPFTDQYSDMPRTPEINNPYAWITKILHTFAIKNLK